MCPSRLNFAALLLWKPNTLLTSHVTLDTSTFSVLVPLSGLRRCNLWSSVSPEAWRFQWVPWIFSAKLELLWFWSGRGLWCTHCLARGWIPPQGLSHPFQSLPHFLGMGTRRPVRWFCLPFESTICFLAAGVTAWSSACTAAVPWQSSPACTVLL